MTLIDITEFVTVQRIPVLETGIAYPASTGPFTCTLEMLEEAVLSQQDPHIKPPRIKIGHSDNPINEDLQELWEELNTERDESKPALGSILNLAVEEESILYGDFYGMPAWLAAILETAYPARSIEGGHWKNEANNKDYAFMLEAVSFLGVVGPGCTSLEDLQELFSKDGPQVSVVEMSKPKHKVKTKGGGPMPVVAQVNVEDIRRAFYDDFAQGDRYWWWDRELLIDPLEFIVQDPDENQLYRLPIDLKDGDGTDSVEFGDPEPIKVKYVPDPSANTDDDVKAARLIAPQLEKAGKVLAVNTNPPRADEHERSKKGTTMGKVNVPALRARLGVGKDVLPDDATEEQINAALEADPPEEEKPQVDPLDDEHDDVDDEDDSDDDDEDDDTDDDDGDVKATRGVTLDKDAHAQLKQEASEGREARKEQLKVGRKGYLDKAQAKGKFPPAARKAYAKQLAKGGEIEKATKEFIDALPDNTVPVEEIGDGAADTELASSAYDESWLTPAERRRIKAAKEGEHDPVTKERVGA